MQSLYAAAHVWLTLPPALQPAVRFTSKEASMVKISEKQSGTPLGTLDDSQFQFLADHLEEESLQDDDYYLNRTTVDFLADAGADPALLEILRRALGDRDEAEIRWERS
jgi:processive 1,2-diacylglycerol beta-glucosyltransferase